MPLKPLALGVVQVGESSAASRRRARIALAAFAHEEGFALLDTVEVGTNELRDDLAVSALATLAQRNRVRAVFTAGAVSARRLREAGLPATVKLMAVPPLASPV